VDRTIIRSGPRKVAVLDAQHAVHYRDVRLGRDFGDEIEVLTGLNAGDTVVVHPGDDLPRSQDTRSNSKRISTQLGVDIGDNVFCEGFTWGRRPDDGKMIATICPR
jgi:hypothetical protein